MRLIVDHFLTQAGQRPFFSGSSSPQREQRVRSSSGLIRNGSPLRSCSRPRATSENLAASVAEKGTATVGSTKRSISSLPPPTRGSVLTERIRSTGTSTALPSAVRMTARLPVTATQVSA